MFLRSALLLTLVFLCITMALVFVIIDFSNHDFAIYQKLQQESRPNDSLEMKKYQGKQERDIVIKNIWYSQPTATPLHFLLSCKESTLTFNVDIKNSEIIEEMHDVICIMQEELFYRLPDGREVHKEKGSDSFLISSKEGTAEALSPKQLSSLIPMQKLRYITADTAFYSYDSGRFTAEKVYIRWYEVPGHKLQTSFEEVAPLIQGIADSVEFSLAGDGLNFKAEHLKAMFFSPGGNHNDF